MKNNRNEPNISVYNEGVGDDFPVLKAFQQYIDAEQAKSRQRLLTVSIIFVVVLLAVIAIFSSMLIRANDRLVDFAMKNPNGQTSSASDEANETIRSLTATIEELQSHLEEQNRKLADSVDAVAKGQRELKPAAAVKTAKTAVSDKRTQELEARLQQALDQLKAEKQKFAEEKEKLRKEQLRQLHEEELERYRREHYPEFYAKKDRAVKADKSPSSMTPDEIESEVDKEVTYEELEEDDVQPIVRKTKTQIKEDPLPVMKKTSKNGSGDLADDEAVQYFQDDDYTIPVEVKGKKAGWYVPMD